jgi:hypothetical protein
LQRGGLGFRLRSQRQIHAPDDRGLPAPHDRACQGRRYERIDHQYVLDRVVDQRSAEPLCLWSEQGGDHRPDPRCRHRFRLQGNPLQRADKALAMFVARQPMGRLGESDEVAALAVYLAADESAFVTGTAIPIDGGFSL